MRKLISVAHARTPNMATDGFTQSVRVTATVPDPGLGVPSLEVGGPTATTA